jgi:hypothetical protein
MTPRAAPPAEDPGLRLRIEPREVYLFRFPWGRVELVSTRRCRSPAHRDLSLPTP